MTKEKKSDLILVFLGSFLLSLVLFFGLGGRNPQGLLVFQPFWYLETMMQLGDRVSWSKFGEAMVNYRAGGVWLKATVAYGVAFLIFVLGNFGTRLLAFGYRKLGKIEVFLFSIVVAGILIPMLFLQKGTPWNTIQFIYYSLFFSGIWAGMAVGKLKSLGIVGSSLIMLLTIPTTAIALKEIYLPGRPPAKVSSQELEALFFLRNQTEGVVLTYSFDSVKAKEAEVNPPRPLYLYESTAYVAAFSEKTVFLEDQVNLDITGYDWKIRRVEVEGWYKETDQQKARDFLEKNKIRYVYWLKGDKKTSYLTEQRAYLGEAQLGLTKIFENNEVNLYMVRLED
jgi:hypothetical protein